MDPFPRGGSGGAGSSALDELGLGGLEADGSNILDWLTGLAHGGDPFGWRGPGGIDSAVKQKIKQSFGGGLLSHLSQPQLDQPDWGEPGFSRGTGFGGKGFGKQLVGQDVDLVEAFAKAQCAEEKFKWEDDGGTWTETNQANCEKWATEAFESELEAEQFWTPIFEAAAAAARFVKDHPLIWTVLAPLIWPDFEYGPAGDDGAAGGLGSAGLDTMAFPEQEPQEVADPNLALIRHVVLTGGQRHNQWLWGPTPFSGLSEEDGNGHGGSSGGGGVQDLRRALLGGVATPSEWFYGL